MLGDVWASFVAPNDDPTLWEFVIPALGGCGRNTRMMHGLRDGTYSFTTFIFQFGHLTSISFEMGVGGWGGSGEGLFRTVCVCRLEGKGVVVCVRVSCCTDSAVGFSVRLLGGLQGDQQEGQ